MLTLAIIATYSAAFYFLIIRLARKQEQESAQAIELASAKHIRACYYSDRVKIAYYGDNGRKVTMRYCSFADYPRIRKQAAAKGYRVI